MPRFFFHLHNDIETTDDEGMELPDLRGARQMAEENAREMAAESVRLGRLDLGHSIEVTDERGDTVLTVTFGQAIKIIH